MLAFISIVLSLAIPLWLGFMIGQLTRRVEMLEDLLELRKDGPNA